MGWVNPMACNSTKELNAVLQKIVCSWKKAAQPQGALGRTWLGPLCI